MLDSTSLRVLHLQNSSLEVSVLPEIGAKIYDVIHRPTDHNFLWHNPRIRPQTYAVEANFDNYWCGGWDDAFPTWDISSTIARPYSEPNDTAPSLPSAAGSIRRAAG